MADTTNKSIRLEMYIMAMSDEQKKKISEANKARHAKNREDKAAKASNLEATLDAQMKKMEVEAKATARANEIAARKKALEDLKLSKPDKRVTKNKCHRHPDIDVKPGENCEKCIGQSTAYDNVMNITKSVLPCPKCGQAKREEEGGSIKTFYSKKGHYGCGKCSISYNVKGEATDWSSGKDQSLLEQEIRFRRNK